MKQESGKKSKKLLLIIIAIAALLAAAAVALVLILGNAGGGNQGDTPAGENPASAIYWNLDRIQYTKDSETGLSTREQGSDGMYTFRFAVNGKVVEFKTADKQLVNFIDTQDALGLVLDDNGIIIDAINVKDIAIEVAKEFYVKRIMGASIMVNSSVAMNGLDLTLGLPESANIIDVRLDSDTMGQAVTLEVMDVVSIYCNLDGEVTDVFLCKRTESSPLYVRTARYYKNGATSRTPDENGVYTISFAINGEIQQLKCKDKDLVTSIDYGRDANAVMGLEFDEEGYIVKKLDASGAVRGKLLCDGFNIVSISGEEFEATRLMSGTQQGASVTFTLTEDTTIVMMEDGCGYTKGQLLNGLKHHDRVTVWSDMDNNALFIKLDRRIVEDPDIKMYYSPTRYYIYRDDRSYRTADENGYYNFDVVCEGKVSTVKTKDKDLVYKMDKNEYQFFGLKVEKGIVKEYYDPNCLTGGSSLTQRYVVDSMATIVRLVYTSNFSEGSNYMMSSDIVVYDMTGYIGKLGSKTTLQVGDRVISQTDVEGKLTHVFVLDRPASGTKFYYNADRQYSSSQKSTTRTPDAEGYYVYKMFCEGKEVTVKTKNKDYATLIDLQEAPICALKVNKNGIITGAYAAIAGQPYTTKSYSYNYIEKVDFDKSLTGYTFSGGQKVYNNASYQLADDCKIYNVSNNFKSHRGEKTTIKAGDRIQALYSYDTKKITHVWVMSRMVDTPLYSNPYPQNSSSGTKRTPDADGYYSVQLFVDGELKTLRTKNKSIMDTIEKYGDNEDFFAAVVEGDIIKSVDSYNASKRAIRRLTVNFDVTKISGKTITTERLRPGQSNTGDTSTFKITSKTKIYDTCSYSENRFASVKLKVGDRVTAFADENGNVNYVFVTAPNSHKEGHISKCPHCNKKVWWEPWTGNFISTAEEAHYYLPVNYRRNRISTVGSNPQTSPNALRYTAVVDLNGNTFTSYNTRNLTVYSDLVLVDTVGGGTLEALGTSGGAGGNIYVDGGSVVINDGVTLRMYNSAATKASEGGNVYVVNRNVTDENGKVTKTYTGKLTINDAVLDGWSCYSGNILMNAGTVLNLNGGTIKNGNVELIGDAKFNWKGGKIESNLTINGGTQALSGKPDLSGILMNTNGGKVDISNLSVEASIKALPTGVFTTESDNIDAYLSVFTSALPNSCTISKAGKALTAGESLTIPGFTENLEFVSGTQTAICPACAYLVTWQPITDAQKLQTGTHYYLANDITHTGSSAALDLDARGAFSCLHLNGHNLTATANNAIYMGGKLNIMGSGVVSGNRSSSGRGVTLDANSAATEVNIYSGTYTKYSTGNTLHVVGLSNAGTINIYEDATIDARGTSGTAVRASRGTVTIYGGKIHGGSEGYAVLAVSGSYEPVINILGGLMQAGDGYSVGATASGDLKAKLNIAGGNIVGKAPIISQADVQIGGAVKMDHLFAQSGARITLGELIEGASITVDGEPGVFTNPSENAALYIEKQYIKPMLGKLLEIQDNALALLEDPNVFPADPEIPEMPTLLEVDNSNLVFEEGTTNAKCPVCDKVVTWTPITGRTVMQPGNHYYLAQDITHTASNTALDLDKRGSAVCLHLNGHNLTATAHNAIYLGGYINIMGNGTVSGNRNQSGRGVTLDGNSGATNAHIYGGTYTKYSTSNTLHVVGLSNAGTVNIYKGATVDARGTTGTAVRTSRGPVNIYGGEIYGGSDGYAVLAASGSYEPTVNIFGGLIQAGEGYSVGATASAENKANLNIYGGDIVGETLVNNAANVIIGGTAKMDKLIVEEGCKFTLTEMSEGASIAVKANGIFTNPSNYAKTYVNYFSGLGGCADPTVVDGALFAEVHFDPTADFAAPLAFAEGTKKAECLYCGKTVEWIAISEIAATYELEAGKHYYLANDITAAVAGNAITYTNTDSIKCACLHLNGHNLANTQGVAIYTNGTLSIMGNGRVSGNELEANCGATVAVSGPTAKLNLLSGTYVKASDNTVNSIAAVYSAGGTINMYNAAVIDGTGLSSKSVPTCVRLDGTKGDEIKKAVLNIYGGTIQNGTITNQNGGNIRIFNNGEINMYGGLITGGKATATSGYGLGGNIYSEVGQINILGGAISNGVGRIGGNIAIKACTLTIENASVIGGSTIEGATAPHGGNISLDEKATLNVKSGAVIANGLAYNQGGNIRCVNSTINMTGGEIYGGEAKSGNQNHNVWLTSTSTMNFSGGTITGRATATVIGGAIFVVTGSKLNLSGTATVIDNCDYAGIRVAAEDLTYDSNWTGSANIANP